MACSRRSSLPGAWAPAARSSDPAAVARAGSPPLAWARRLTQARGMATSRPPSACRRRRHLSDRYGRPRQREGTPGRPAVVIALGRLTGVGGLRGFRLQRANWAPILRTWSSTRRAPWTRTLGSHSASCGERLVGATLRRRHLLLTKSSCQGRRPPAAEDAGAWTWMVVLPPPRPWAAKVPQRSRVRSHRPRHQCRQRTVRPVESGAG